MEPVKNYSYNEDEATSRTALMFGADGVKRLRNAHVLIAGAGAVGGFCLEALARVGIANITVIDCDTISISNLNRQLLALTSTLEQAKADLARARISDINPLSAVQALNLRITRDNAAQILADFAARSDNSAIIVDAIDVVDSKIGFLAAAVRGGFKTYSAMGAALRTDPSLIKTASLAATSGCPLASLVRKGLRKEEIDLEAITCVFSPEPPQAVPCDTDMYGKRILGSLPTLTGIFGLTLANRIIFDLVKG